MTTHVFVGDPSVSGTSGTLDSFFCSCACSVCMAGSCCQWNSRPFTVQRDTTIPFAEPIQPVIRTWPMDADGNPLVGYWRCACQTVVPPGVEHRCPQ